MTPTESRLKEIERTLAMDGLIGLFGRNDMQFMVDLVREQERKLGIAVEALQYYAVPAKEADLEDIPGSWNEYGCGCCAGNYDKDGIVDCGSSVQGLTARNALAEIRKE